MILNYQLPLRSKRLGPLWLSGGLNRRHPDESDVVVEGFERPTCHEPMQWQRLVNRRHAECGGSERARSVGVVTETDSRLGQPLLQAADRRRIDGRARQRQVAEVGEAGQLADPRG